MTALTIILTLIGMGILSATRASLMDFGVNITLRSSCKLSPDVMSYHMNCLCDDSCFTFGDCCADKLNTNEAASSVLLQQNIGRMTCVNDSHIGVPVYILQKCVEYFPDEKIREKCELSPNQQNNTFLNLPVTGLESGILYRNFYCALCNNERFFDLWHVNISSNNRELLDVVSENASKCDWLAISELKHMVKYSHPVYEGHMCKNPISQCAENWPDEDIKGACSREPANFVYHGYKTYKNINCARCNHVKSDDYYLTSLDVRGFQHIPGPQRFSILLNMTSNSVTTEEWVDDEGRWVTSELVLNVHHKEGQVYDPFTNEYQVVSCPPTHIMKEATCFSAAQAAVRCPMETIIRLQKPEFEYLSNNSLSVISPRSVYPPGEYWSNGIYVLICNQTYTSLEQFISQHQSYGYASLALLCLSFLCIVMQLVVHSFWFPMPKKVLVLMCFGACMLAVAVIITMVYIGIAYLYFGGPGEIYMYLIPWAILPVPGVFLYGVAGLLARKCQFTLYFMQSMLLCLALNLFYLCIIMPNMIYWYASAAVHSLHILASLGIFCLRRQDHPHVREGERSERDVQECML